MRVYEYQTLIRIRKLKAKYKMSRTSCGKSLGGCPIKVKAPMERAKPKIKSESDSMRDFGVARSFLQP